MNNFEIGIKKYLKEDELEKIRKVRVGIAGAGGLGSNCAVNLVRCGFCRFVIADYDVVDGSNLNRQFFFNEQVEKSKVEMLKENLEKINPDVEITVVEKKIEKNNIKEFFENCDVIVEAFDEASYKKMIVETYMKSEKFLVAASGMGGFGNSDNIVTKKIRDNFYIVGDFVSEVNENCPPLSPSVNITAAKQADVILTYILRKSKGANNECS